MLTLANFAKNMSVFFFKYKGHTPDPVCVKFILDLRHSNWQQSHTKSLHPMLLLIEI